VTKHGELKRCCTKGDTLATRLAITEKTASIDGIIEQVLKKANRQIRFFDG